MKIRNFDQIRAAAMTRGQIDRARKILAEAEVLNGWRGKLRHQSDRQSVVEWFWGCKMADMTGDQRTFAEEIAFDAKPEAAARFGEYHIGGRLDALPTAALVSEFEKRYAEELATEIEAQRESLRPHFEAVGLAHELEAAAPIRELQKRLQDTRDSIARANGDLHAVQTIFRLALAS